MLNFEQLREPSESRLRLRVVQRGETSRSVSRNFGRRSREPESLKTLETLAKAASDWCLIKKQINHAKGAEILINFTERLPLLALTLRKNIIRATLRFRVEGEKHTSRPKSDQYSGFSVGILFKKNGIKQMFCLVGDHRGCGLVEKCLQAVKRKLDTMQLEPNFTDIQSVVKLIMEDIQTVKQTLLKKKHLKFILDGSRILVFCFKETNY